MKRIIIFLAFFFKIIMPHIENGTFTFSDKLMAQGMGDESMCGLVCATFTAQIPCSLMGVTTCGDPITITPPQQTTCPYCGSPYCHGECRSPLPPVNPNTYDTCDPRNPYYNPCYCTGCGSTPLPPANPNPPTPPNPNNPPTPPADTAKVKVVPRGNCGPTASNNSYTVSTVYSNPGWSYYPWQLAGMAESGYPYEQCMVLNKNSNSNTDYSTSGLYQGDAHHVGNIHFVCADNTDIYGVTIKIGSVALMHSHPIGGYPAPSAGDVYGMIETNQGCSIFRDDFVLAFNKEKFVLHLEDPSLVSTFSATYPKATNYDPVGHGFLVGSPLFVDFDKAKTAFVADGYTDRVAYELAFAYILNSKNSGIKLMKKDGEFFKEVRVTSSVDAKGKVTYSVTWCY